MDRRRVPREDHSSVRIRSQGLVQGPDTGSFRVAAPVMAAPGVRNRVAVAVGAGPAAVARVAAWLDAAGEVATQRSVPHRRSRKPRRQ